MTICKKNLEEYLEADELYDATVMQTRGESPWGGTNCPEGVWCWDKKEDEVLVGTCAQDAEIVSYKEAREIFKSTS